MTRTQLWGTRTHTHTHTLPRDARGVQREGVMHTRSVRTPVLQDTRLQHGAQRTVFTHTPQVSTRAHTHPTRAQAARAHAAARTHDERTHPHTPHARTHPVCTHPCAHLQAHSVHPATRALVERTSHGGTRKLLHRRFCRLQLSLWTIKMRPWSIKMRLWKPKLTLRKGKVSLWTLSVELWTLNRCALPEK